MPVQRLRVCDQKLEIEERQVDAYAEASCLRQILPNGAKD